MAKKAATNPKIRTKCTKSAVKTAKKPVLRENIAAEPVQKSSQNTPRRKIDNIGDKAHHFEAGEMARTIGAKGGKQKGINAAIRRDLLYLAANRDTLAKKFMEALVEPNPELANIKLQFVKEAAKLVGATHDQSPEASQNVNLKADVKKAETVKLVIEDFTKPEQGEKDGGAAGE